MSSLARLRALSARATSPDARAQLELRVGELQFRSLRWMLMRVAGLRRGQVRIPGAAVGLPEAITMPYLYRGAWTEDVAPIVCVHGFGGDKETWLMLASALPRHRPLILLDLPGFGEASPIRGGFAVPAAGARAVCAFLEALGAARVHLVGNSLGGGVSLCTARSQPERVRSLVLINSLGPRATMVLGPSDYRRALDRGENPLIPRNPREGEHLLEMVMARPPRLPRSVLRYAASQRVAMQGRLTEMFHAWQSCAPDEDVPAELHCLDMPALVLCGERDRVIHPATSRALAGGLARAELCTLDDVGHMPQLEAPRRTAQIVTRFLATIDG